MTRCAHTLNPCKFCGQLIPKPPNMDWWKYHRLMLCPGEWTVDARGKRVLIRSNCQVEYSRQLGREKGALAKAKGTGARGVVEMQERGELPADYAFPCDEVKELEQARLNIAIDKKRHHDAFARPRLPGWLVG